MVQRVVALIVNLEVHNIWLSLYYILHYYIWQPEFYLQIDSKLPYVCSVIDHRWLQNRVKAMKWHTSRWRVCHWCFYRILTSSVIYYWTDPRQHGIYLFYRWSEKKKERYTYLYRTAWLFEDFCYSLGIF